MNNTSFSKLLLFVFTVVLFASCDNDFNDVGGNIIGDDNFNVDVASYQIKAFNHNVGPAQSNNLPINALGIYKNPAFGTTTANFVTQLEVPLTNPTIVLGLHPMIESAILTIPYFSHKLSTVDGVTTYKLDSIYGPDLETTASRIKLSVYESKYTFRGFDSGTGEAQIYYTNQNAAFEGSLDAGQEILNNSGLPSENTAFFFDKSEKADVTAATDGGADVTTKVAPRMELHLKNLFFQDKLFTSLGTGKLATNDAFKAYIKGLHFKVENTGADEPSMALINFARGKITVKYKEDISLTDSDPMKRVSKTFTINLTGDTVNLFEQSNVNTDYSTAINSPNLISGDDKIYLKGGEGSMAIIKLFGDEDIVHLDEVTGMIVPGGSENISDELDRLRASKRLINDASITFKVDRTKLNDLAGINNTSVLSEPNRIYLFDLVNKTPLLDYSYDGTTRPSYKENKYVHGGILPKEAKDQYKIKITNHIRNLINDHTVKNVELGLVVTENINDASNIWLQNEIPVYDTEHNLLKKRFPKASVMNPLGTILFGNTANVSDGDKIKFEIHYTNPN